MLNIVLVAPEIPHNTGAAGRLSLATGSRLHLVKPLGFSLEDKYLKRSGLDYWGYVDLHIWENFSELHRQAKKDAGFWYLSAHADQSLWDAKFRDGDYLVFGRETQGLPPSMLEQSASHALRIPMRSATRDLPTTRSLNLSTAIAITLYEAHRQIGIL